MSATEIGILALGVLVVLGVIAYNKWQERQHRQNMENAFRSPRRRDDVLLSRREVDFSVSLPDIAPKTEPTLREDADKTGETGYVRYAGDAGYDVDVGEAGDAGDAVDAGEALPEAATASYVGVALPEDDLLSPMIDLIAELHGASVIDLAALRRNHAKSLLPFGRRLNWAGLNEADSTWEFLPGNAPEGGGRYRRLRVGLQLVDRDGVAKAEVVSGFLDFFPRLAEGMGLTCLLPEAELSEWMEHAAQLDVFCAGLDIVLCLSLVPDGGKNFTGTQIRALAEAENMTLEDGIYIMRDEHGVPLFRFWNTDEAHPFRVDEMKHLKSGDLTFHFDVPCVPRGQHVYLQMLAVIRRFAKVLGGVLIDDQGNPLSDETLEQIRQDYVIRPQGHMMSEGLPAGSFLARRLFS